ncbi:MAG: 16S rRNA (uracil(1498)-N(3))-methyltransferase [Opitutae bacterium]|nr:16S rRNA (uracil(1498)-N(3))-methyltransferase [Opitutae bacterium]
MNLILFTPDEAARPLPVADPRAVHLLTVLRRREGDTFDAGLIDGPRGKGTLVARDHVALTLSFAWGEPPPPLDPITLLVGLPRPQTARKILQEATALGVAAIHFVATEKGEPSYAQSTLWSSGEWRRHALAGAEQAFCTRLPAVSWGRPLAELVAALPPATHQRIALDNYEASVALGQCPLRDDTAVALALGPERGWSAQELAVLRAGDFTLAHLGTRVLRSETAAVAAVALLKAKLGRM